LPDEQKLKAFRTTKPGLQKVLREILHAEEEEKYNHENTGKNNSH
jgi:hypothetical protein